jgi:uncharacterized protein YfaS (alpha-2-macroglobulin family)
MKKLFLPLLVTLTLFFVSCENKRSEKSLNNLIIGHTSGNMVDPEGMIRVQFSEVPERFKGLSKEEKNKVFSIDPAVEGDVFQIDEKVLAFNPVKNLQFDKEYSVTIFLDKLFDKPEKNKYVFKIKTAPLYFSFNFNGMDILSEDGKSRLRVEGTLTSSLKVNKEELKAVISAVQNGRELPVLLTPKGDNTYTVMIDSVKKLEKESLVTFILKGRELGSKDLTKKYKIPSVTSFTLLDYDVKKSPEPHLELIFSNNLDPSSNLDGMIYFSDGSKSSISVKGNVVKLYPEKVIYGKKQIVVSKNIRDVSGKHLVKEYDLEFYFKMLKPQVKFTGKGNILAGTDHWLIPFSAVNLKAVDVVVFKVYANNIGQFLQVRDLDEKGWSLNRVGEYVHHQKIVLDSVSEKPENEWKGYFLDLSKMIRADQGAIYMVDLKFRPSYAITDCNTSFPKDDFSDSTSYLYGKYYYPTGYKWNKRNEYCDVSYYNDDVFASKNFFATNIGLTVKEQENNRYKVFVFDLLDARPMSNVTVTFFTYQNQKIGETTTNSDGEADVSLDRKAFLVVAENSGQYGYLKVQGGYALSYSKFDVSGMKPEKGLKGYLFGERGVWRPGDTLFLSFIMKDPKKMIPADHPVIMEVYDALDKKVYTDVNRKGENGFYVFKVPTGEDAPTGYWKAVVKVGNQKFTKELRVETILPNRMKIDLTSSVNRFVKGSKSNRVFMDVKWLHGGIAGGLKADVTESIAVTKTLFKGYKDFVFDDPSLYFYPEEKNVFKGKLDEKGHAEFRVYEPGKKELPGTLQFNFTAKVFEAGGRFSIEEKSFEYLPYTSYVGFKPPAAGVNDYYETGKSHSFKVVTLDEKGNKISVKDLEVKIYKLEWSWWYHSSENNLASYMSRNYRYPAYSGVISTKNGTGGFSFKVKDSEWGRYFIKVADANGGHSAGMITYFDWPASYARENRSRTDATLLTVTSDKKSYQPGEKAVVSFPTSEGAKALISIERNDKILRSFWVETQKNRTIVEIDITREMAPNVYAFVSVIQPQKQTINDLPIRSYGVIPLTVNDPNTYLHPEIRVPEKIKPESEYKITVSEKSNKEMTYVLAVVDEGLLNLTGFKTPSPHNYFYSKEALVVKTWDYYDYVAGAFGEQFNKVFAIGGSDGGQTMPKKKKINRFKPVVSFYGPFTLKAGSSGETHTLTMPNYIGSVRVMVVAANKDGAYGSTEKSVKVKTPLMILASLPRTLVPGERLKIPVTVFVMEESLPRVKIKTTTNEMLDVKNSVQSRVIFHPGEYILYVDVKVADRTGTGKISFTVEASGHKAHYDVDVRIVNPGKRVYKTKKQYIDKKESFAVKPDLPKNSFGQQLSVTVSGMPSVNLEKRLDYLIKYPYGCVEQVTSAAFPQLFLNDLMELNKDQQRSLENNVNAAVRRLGDYQTISGGFSYWPNSGAGSDSWASSYVGHFLLKAKENGYFVPPSMLSKWKDFQEKQTAAWRKSRRWSDLDQAYRLYTLALAGDPDVSAMNRMREMPDLSAQASARLAAAYALIEQKRVAAELVNTSFTRDFRTDNYWRYNYGSVVRDDALALETFLLIGDKTKAYEHFKLVTEALGSDKWMSTQTTSFALYAVSLFVKNPGEKKNLSFDLVHGKQSESITADKPFYVIRLKPEDDLVKVNNRSDNPVFIEISSSWINAPGEKVNVLQNLDLEVNYYTMLGNPVDISALKQGENFYAKVEVKNKMRKDIDHLALTFQVPSGWEMLNTRLFDVGKDLKSSESEYVDFRDDRADIFFGLERGAYKKFYLLFTAAYPGRFFILPVICGDMYDHSVNAAVGGGKVSVELN